MDNDGSGLEHTEMYINTPQSGRTSTDDAETRSPDRIAGATSEPPPASTSDQLTTRPNIFSRTANPTPAVSTGPRINTATQSQFVDNERTVAPVNRACGSVAFGSFEQLNQSSPSEAQFPYTFDNQPGSVIGAAITTSRDEAVESPLAYQFRTDGADLPSHGEQGQHSRKHSGHRRQKKTLAGRPDRMFSANPGDDNLLYDRALRPIRAWQPSLSKDDDGATTPRAESSANHAVESPFLLTSSRSDPFFGADTNITCVDTDSDSLSFEERLTESDIVTDTGDRIRNLSTGNLRAGLGPTLRISKDADSIILGPSRSTPNLHSLPDIVSPKSSLSSRRVTPSSAKTAKTVTFARPPDKPRVLVPRKGISLSRQESELSSIGVMDPKAAFQPAASFVTGTTEAAVPITGYRASSFSSHFDVQGPLADYVGGAKGKEDPAHETNRVRLKQSIQNLFQKRDGKDPGAAKSMETKRMSTTGSGLSKYFKTSANASKPSLHNDSVMKGGGQRKSQATNIMTAGKIRPASEITSSLGSSISTGTHSGEHPHASVVRSATHATTRSQTSHVMRDLTSQVETSPEGSENRTRSAHIAQALNYVAELSYQAKASTEEAQRCAHTAELCFEAITVAMRNLAIMLHDSGDIDGNMMDEILAFGGESKENKDDGDPSMEK